MNELATLINEYIDNKGIKKQFIADKIGLTKQGLYMLMRKKQFGVTEANRILSAIDCKLMIDIVPVDPEIDRK